MQMTLVVDHFGLVEDAAHVALELLVVVDLAVAELHDGLLIFPIIDNYCWLAVDFCLIKTSYHPILRLSLSKCRELVAAFSEVPAEATEDENMKLYVSILLKRSWNRPTVSSRRSSTAWTSAIVAITPNSIHENCIFKLYVMQY